MDVTKAYFYFLKAENQFLEGLKEDFEDLLRDFMRFFESIKELVYDNLVDKFGETPINILMMGIGFLLLMLILSKIINH